MLAVILPLFLGSTNVSSNPQIFMVNSSVEAESFDFYYEFGRFSAWICTGLYLFSRLPQIYHNWKRHSCDGLAIAMFFCAMLGNITYASSILVKQTSHKELYAALPYLLGSLGTIGFDVIIFLQYKYYPTRTINS